MTYEDAIRALAEAMRTRDNAKAVQERLNEVVAHAERLVQEARAALTQCENEHIAERMGYCAHPSVDWDGKCGVCGKDLCASSPA
jgi:DNA repair exonuclease SbcCD ATPase subunit